ncbi:MAG: MarR family winged helix-turn-helix transcriptional regulator [Actinomycetia bacterium]|nr:MarR family winged helix-turn-helix transcriptional regulator [Actinomycetes bacterium]
MADQVEVQTLRDEGLHDLGWALGAVLRTWLKATSHAVEDLPGGPRGYQVLSMATGGPCGTQAAMAERIGVDRTVMTHLIDDLEAADLVERKPDPADRRVRRVILTPRGRSTYVELAARIDHVERKVLSGLDDPSIDELRGLLLRAASALDDQPIDSCDVAVQFNLDR